MKKYILVATFLAVLLSACGGGTDSGEWELALKQYRAIIGKADTYEFSTDTESTGYQYALVQMQKEDTVPTLLLKEKNTSLVDYIRLFQYDPESGLVDQPAEVLLDGADAVGGYWGSIAMQEDDNGIIRTETSADTGETCVSRVTLEYGHLIGESQWEGRIDVMPGSLGFVPITWYDIDDASASWPEPGTREGA